MQICIQIQMQMLMDMHMHMQKNKQIFLRVQMRQLPCNLNATIIWLAATIRERVN